MKMLKKFQKKIGLGTAQFGMDYGISNVLKQTSRAEVKNILDYAAAKGIGLLDTALSYGDSETAIGNSLPKNHNFRIVTKTCPCDGDYITKEHVRDVAAGFHQSLKKLCQSSIYGLLVHYCDDLLKPGGELLVESLQMQKSEGLVKKIGVSVYTGEQIDSVLKLFTPDIIQLPLNILDQRLIKHGWLLHLKAEGVEIHARSIFLQGLLLMDANRLDAYFDPIKKHLDDFHNEIKSLNITPLKAALDFALEQADVDIILVGVAALKQLKEICFVVSQQQSYSMNYSEWALQDARFLDPSQWNLTKETAVV